MDTELSGSEFNKIYNGTTFYKFLNNNLIHHGFKYQQGLNIDTKPFKPYRYVTDDGLHFYEESAPYFHIYYSRHGERIAFIEIPDDARVYIGTNNFKSDKVIITNILSFYTMPDEFWIKMLHKRGDALKYIKTQTYEICKFAVQRPGRALKYVHEQTDELCKLAVQTDGMSLEYVHEQTQEICNLAVQKCAFAVNFVNEEFRIEEICELTDIMNKMDLSW